jgi:hypothetical protein
MAGVYMATDLDYKEYKLVLIQFRIHQIGCQVSHVSPASPNHKADPRKAPLGFVFPFDP